jgi:hypothetical protein
METAFRHVKEESVIGNEEVERRQETEGESHSESGYRGGEDQYGENEYVGESIQQDEGLEEA